MVTEGFIRRADDLSVGDFIVSREWTGEVVVYKINDIQVVGDDVVLNNGMTTMSVGTLVVCLGRFFTVA